MISLRNLTKEYSRDGQILVRPVNDVTLDIGRGEFIVIVGRSGSGKTTLLNLIAGLVRPTAGAVIVNNVNLEKMSKKELFSLRAEQIGFVFQFPSLLSSLTVLENVMMPTTFCSRNGFQDNYSRAVALLQTVGLSERVHAYPKELSAGEQKRTVLARSLINNPVILLADEPTSDLDEQTENEIVSFIRETHATGMTVVMVTHSLQLLSYADRAFTMEQGSILVREI